MSRTRRAAALLAIAATATGVATTVAASPRATAVTTAGIHTRAQVPWSQVGDGWTAVSVTKNGHTNLVLVSPAGQSYQIATLAASERVDSISHDGKHVLTDYSVSGSWRMRAWDLRAGKVSTTLPVNAWANFTRPTGSALNVQLSSNTFQRVTVTGRKELSLAHRPDLADLLPHPGGLYDAATALAGKPVTLYSHVTMRAIRTYGMPKGAKGCSPVGWANSSTLLEACTMKQLGEISQLEVYRQNIKGGAPQAVTTGSWAGDITNPFGQGFLDADQTVLGTVATAHNDDIAGKRSTVYRVKSGRVVGSIKAPLAADVARSVDTAKVVGNTVFYTHTNPPMGDNGAVAAYNLATKKVTYLVGPHSQYAGKATSSAVIDPAY
ncbi:hypothetical protein [Flexivirga alba]|uniref:Uncharacterized protein n=1 Tax=Flexivirga alba TaxID=702742 RepID=A0ABW2AAZ7_9MICO